MDSFIDLVKESAGQVALSFIHNWPFLLASIVIATGLGLFVDARKVSVFLGRHRGIGVAAATAAAVGTPLCSCGTTAVVLGMMATTMPWPPIVAFMVASPLSSPEGLVYSAGLFGWPFAIAFFVASILLGLAGGGLAALLESRGWLADQARMAGPVLRGSVGAMRARGVPVAVTIPAASQCGCSAAVSVPAAVREAGKVTKKLLVMFFGFAFIGFFLNGLVPAGWVTAAFGSGRIYGVPLAATLGVPLYLSSEASLPLVRALLDSGMSQGAAMAFLITGSGTSIGAIAGALSIARWRVVALVVGVLWLGAIAVGLGYDLLLPLL
jgi:uncharacterized protein